MKWQKFQLLDMIPEINVKAEEWEKTARNCFERSRKRYRKDSNRAEKNTAEARLDLDDSMVKRRMQALINTRDIIMKRYDRCYDDWIMTNVQTDSYSHVEVYYQILFAASIWILDRLFETDFDKQKLYQLLPTDDRLLDDMFQLDVWDCQYSADLLKSVEYVLRFRNSDIAPMENNGYGGDRVLTSRLATEGNPYKDVPSRQAFEKLLELIPQEKIDHAVQQFTDCFWAWGDRFFAGMVQLDIQEEKARLKVNEIRAEINQQQQKIDKLVHQADEARKKKRSAKPEKKKAPFVASPILAKPLAQDAPITILSDFPPLPSNDFSEQSDILQLLTETGRLHELDDCNRELSEAYKDVLKRKGAFAYCMNHASRLHDTEFDDALDNQFFDSLPTLPEFDCFEMCFALLYLIEQDSDLPWLYGIGVGLMQEVAQYLPWGYIEYNEIEDDFWIDECQPIPEKPVDIPNWYERKYQMKGKDFNLDEKKSLAQIVYEETGCIMPRNMHRYDALAKKLRQYGLRGNNVTAVLYSMLALSNSRHRKNALNLVSFSDSEAQETEQKELSAEQLKEKISAQQKEIHRLQTALHSAEKAAGDANRKLAEYKEKAESERHELADLRERLFYNETDEPVDAVADQKRFPYEVQKDTIIFGGHATFLKTIRQLLRGNIRYVDREQSFDLTMIRYADVLWIQPNAIAHKQFYKVADEARKYNKPMRYFHYASAAKCAEQIIENDQIK